MSNATPKPYTVLRMQVLLITFNVSQPIDFYKQFNWSLDKNLFIVVICKHYWVPKNVRIFLIDWFIMEA